MSLDKITTNSRVCKIHWNNNIIILNAKFDSFDSKMVQMTNKA